MDNIERRVLIPEEAELRVAKNDDGSPRIEGYAAVFGSISVDMGFRERISETAFDAVLRKNPDVRGLYNHDTNYVLGRTKSGTLRIFADTKGLGYALDPPVSRADVIEAVSRRDVTGSSFSFTVATDGEEWIEEDGKLIRQINKFSGLFDVGPVVFPAYADTSVAMRSLDAFRKRVKEEHKEAKAKGVSTEQLRRRLKLMEMGG